MNRPEALIRLLPPCLHWSPDGEVRVVGQRIGLFHIVKAHRELGKSPETIAEEYELAPELIAEVLAFAKNTKRRWAPMWPTIRPSSTGNTRPISPARRRCGSAGLVAERQARESQSES